MHAGNRVVLATALSLSGLRPTRIIGGSSASTTSFSFPSLACCFVLGIDNAHDCVDYLEYIVTSLLPLPYVRSIAVIVVAVYRFAHHL